TAAASVITPATATIAEIGNLEASLKITQTLSGRLVGIPPANIARSAFWAQERPRRIDICLCPQTQLPRKVLLDEAIGQLTSQHAILLGDADVLSAEVHVTEAVLQLRLDATKQLELGLLTLEVTAALKLLPGKVGPRDNLCIAHALSILFFAQDLNFRVTSSTGTARYQHLSRLQLADLIGDAGFVFWLRIWFRGWS
ncbi:MAG: hypothetical protein RI531_09595, partial [Haloferacaceae archaeon]|nr:hypothetical protein [Haloferacaceae archaeon]